MSLYINNASPDDKEAVIALLQQGQLLIDDLPVGLPGFMIAKEEGVSIGVAGIERFDSVALLRSVAVDPEFQGQKIAAQLVNQLVDNSKEMGLKEIYLITTTADHYFKRHGFDTVDRQDVPQAIQQTQQFSSLCPSSAIVMKRSLTQD